MLSLIVKITPFFSQEKRSKGMTNHSGPFAHVQVIGRYTGRHRAENQSTGFRNNGETK